MSESTGAGGEGRRRSRKKKTSFILLKTINHVRPGLDLKGLTEKGLGAEQDEMVWLKKINTFLKNVWEVFKRAGRISY